MSETVYRVVRGVISFALALFYRIEVKHGPGLAVEGATVYVSNHPNSLIDPALVMVAVPQRLTFLAREPLFRVPVFGALLRALGALPLYRRQDHGEAPGQMAKNEGTIAASAAALSAGRAITIFPEGRSHSDPQLGEIKTGCARIVLRAASSGRDVGIVPVGLTYAEKHRFRSRVRVELGEPIVVPAGDFSSAADEPERVRALTEQVSRALAVLTLNLESWEDLPLVETAEALYSLRLGEKARTPERIRRFGRGLKFLRSEQPHRFEALSAEVRAFRRRLALVNATPEALTFQYRRTEVYPFLLRNTLALFLGFPLFAFGCVAFGAPFMLVRLVSRAVKVAHDRKATLKFVSALVVAPVWAGALTWAAWVNVGSGLGLAVLFGCVPLAVYTRYFLERRRAAVRDVVTFLSLSNRLRLKASLLAEGERLADEIEDVAGSYRARVLDEEAAITGEHAPVGPNARGAAPSERPDR